MLSDGVLEQGWGSRTPEPPLGRVHAGSLFSADYEHFPLTAAQVPIAVDAMALPDAPVANTGDIAHVRGHIDSRLFAEAVRRVVAETAAIRVSLKSSQWFTASGVSEPRRLCA